MIFATLVVSAALATGLYITFRPSENSFSYFATSDGTFGSRALFMSICATFVGPGLSMGYMGQGFSSGWVFLIVGYGYAFQLIITGLLVAPRIRERFAGAISLSDIIPDTDHPTIVRVARLGIGITSFSIMLGVTGIMISISGGIASSVLNVPVWVGNLAVALIVTGYSINGGISASIKTDGYQFIVFAIGLSIICALLAIGSQVSFGEVFERGLATANTEIVRVGWLGLFVVFFSFTIGDYLQPPFFSRILAGKSSKSVKTAFIAAGLFCLFWFPLILLPGVIASTAGVDVPDPDSTLFVVADLWLTSPLATLTTILILVVVLSSHDSLLNSASTVFTRDVYGALLDRKYADVQIEGSRALWIARIGIVVCSATALISSLTFPGIISSLLFLASLWVPMVLFPVLYAVFYETANARTMLTGMAAGAIGSLTSTFVADITFPPILSGACCAIGAMLLGSLFFGERKIA